jgi:cytochrome c oxidase subunit 3
MLHRDDIRTKMGMWVFLFTELILFGGLFLVYSVYRWKFSDEFYHASLDLDVFVGTVNTIVLITSSLTVALSITAIQRNKPKLAKNLIYFTVLFALAFLVNKYFEWSAKYEHELFPGMAHYNELPGGERLFFNLYFLMTGLHAIHVIVGAIILLFMVRMINKGSIAHDNFVYLENGGLYWHLVDLIWIYLFPLFYLIH